MVSLMTMNDHRTEQPNRGRRPAWRALLLIGSLGPLGHCPASGTVTVALVGIPLFWVTRAWSATSYVGLILVVSAAAVWIHHVGDQALGEKDSRTLVWDEIVGFLIAVTLIPFSWSTVIAAFLIERAIDIVKVPPARWIERTWPGGWGDVGDDVVAGLYTAAILHLWIHLM